VPGSSTDVGRPAIERSRLAWPTALAGIFAFSFSAALFKLSGASPAVGSTLRFAYAVPLLVVLAVRAGGLRRGPELAPALIAGVVVGVEVVVWNESTSRIGAGPSTVIVNTASLWLMAIAAVVLRRRIPLRAVAGAAVVVLGLGLLRGAGSHGLDAIGVALAVAAAAMYGAYILLFDAAVTRSANRVAPVLWATAAAVPASLVFAIGLGESFSLTPGQHGWLLLLGIGVQACGWLLVARTLEWFSAVAVSILLLLQPLLATVWGLAFLDEHLVAIQLLGVAVVLVGVAIARPRAVREPAGADVEAAGARREVA
jgi:drug/metabolite transporter (DMT)-like permease